MSFPKLADEDKAGVLAEAIDAVYTMFSGVGTLFDLHDAQTWYSKTQLLYRLLVCWYIADQYPLLVAGTPVMGGVPLKSKKIAGIAITYQDNDNRGGLSYQDLLSGLKSNPWGNKAYLMIRGSAKRIKIGGSK